MMLSNPYEAWTATPAKRARVKPDWVSYAGHC